MAFLYLTMVIVLVHTLLIFVFLFLNCIIFIAYFFCYISLDAIEDFVFFSLNSSAQVKLEKASIPLLPKYSIPKFSVAQLFKKATLRTAADYMKNIIRS